MTTRLGQRCQSCGRWRSAVTDGAHCVVLLRRISVLIGDLVLCATGAEHLCTLARLAVVQRCVSIRILYVQVNSPARTGGPPM